jgi:uncharacterized protein
MIVVSDTSPITNLLRIGRINLLHDLYKTVVIPEAVYREIAVIESQRHAITGFHWIKVVSVTNLSLLDELLDSLDRGEAEAITLARELNAELLLIDETDGRAEAKRLNLKITGLLGVLVRAKELDLIPLVSPEIEKLKTDAQFWIDEQLIFDVLVLAGEK